MTEHADRKDRLERQAIHIKGLEAVLAERNRQIERLKEQLSEEGAARRSSSEMRAEYRRGWGDCAAKLMEATRQATRELERARAVGFLEWLAADRMELEEFDD